MSSSSLVKAETTMLKPAIAGALAGGYTYFNYGSDKIDLFSTRVPAWAALGGTVALAALAGEIGGNYVLPPLVKATHGNQKIAGLVTAGVNPALCAGSALLGAKTLAPDLYDKIGANPLLLVGAGAYIAANYVTSASLKSLY